MGADRSAACICGQRDAERDPDATDRVIVPTASDCPVHGSSAACIFPRCVDGEKPPHCGNCEGRETPYAHEYGSSAAEGQDNIYALLVGKTIKALAVRPYASGYDGAMEALDRDHDAERVEDLDAFMERVKDQPYPNSVKRIAWATGQEPREVARRMETIYLDRD